MPSSITLLHSRRLLDQITASLINLQCDMRANALVWLSVAQAKSQPAELVGSWVRDTAASYQGRFAQIAALQADAETWGKIVALLALEGGGEDDITDIATPLKAVADLMSSTSTASYDDIRTLCEQIIAAVDAPPSLWPE